MSFSSQFIDFQATGYFSPLVTDFLNNEKEIRPFYAYDSLQPDFSKAIESRQHFHTDRETLVAELQSQYAGLTTDRKVEENISLLKDHHTFTVCTAHQPNIFTGYLYFVYKILHTVKLAEDLTVRFPGRRFVPVYYMGSEDNDLDELGKIHLDGKVLKWETPQQGAVGRMKTTGLEKLVRDIEYSLGVNENAAYLTDLLKKAYIEQEDIQSATLYLVNALFGKYGVVVLIADKPAFKRAILPVLQEELFKQASFKIVGDTISRLEKHYHAQAHPREINLFYLTDKLRERIVRDEGGNWKVLNTGIHFTREELEKELGTHPERFSPNVILRGILQETILPNIAFIGGGGELAYWLELKDLFEYYKLPYPVILLRNSFLWVNEKETTRLRKLGLEPAALFEETEKLISRFILCHTDANLALKAEYEATEKVYASLEEKARGIDGTLVASVAAERAKAIRSIGKIEHKFLRAEKKKF